MDIEPSVPMDVTSWGIAGAALTLTEALVLWTMRVGIKGGTGDVPVLVWLLRYTVRSHELGGHAVLPGIELMGCQSLAVPAEVMHHVVRVESSFNPYAIGVVGGRLARQPKTLPEALSTVRMLESRGYNFSLGLAQVNRYNLEKYGIDSYERAFDPCVNLQAGSRILAECYSRSGGDWGKSFSCYYSGNFTTGFRHGYVQKIYSSIRQGRDVESAPGAQPIDVIARNARRTVPVSRYPLFTSVQSSVPVTQQVALPPAVSPAQAMSIVAPTLAPANRAPSRIEPVLPRAVPLDSPTTADATPLAVSGEVSESASQAAAISPAPVVPPPAAPSAVPAAAIPVQAVVKSEVTQTRRQAANAAANGEPKTDGAFVF